MQQFQVDAQRSSHKCESVLCPFIGAPHFRVRRAPRKERSRTRHAVQGGIERMMSLPSLRDLPTPRTIVSRCILVVVTIQGFRPSDLFKGYSCRCAFIGPRKKVTALGFGPSDLRTMVTASGFRPSKFSFVGSWSEAEPESVAVQGGENIKLSPYTKAPRAKT